MRLQFFMCCPFSTSKSWCLHLQECEIPSCNTGALTSVISPFLCGVICWQRLIFDRVNVWGVRQVEHLSGPIEESLSCASSSRKKKMQGVYQHWQKNWGGLGLSVGMRGWGDGGGGYPHPPAPPWVKDGVEHPKGGGWGDSIHQYLSKVWSYLTKIWAP